MQADGTEFYSAIGTGLPQLNFFSNAPAGLNRLDSSLNSA